VVLEIPDTLTTPCSIAHTKKRMFCQIYQHGTTDKEILERKMIEIPFDAHERLESNTSPGVLMNHLEKKGGGSRYARFEEDGFRP